MDKKNVERITKALSDPNRIRIIELINTAEWTPMERILQSFTLAQPTLSNHIKQLVNAGLVLTEKDGQYCKYQVNKDVFSDLTGYLSIFEI